MRASAPSASTRRARLLVPRVHLFGVLVAVALLGCDDGASTDGDGASTSGTSSGTGGQSVCSEPIVYGAGELSGLGVRGESVFFLQTGTDAASTALVRADLELETETVLFQQKGLERFVVRGDDVFVAVGEELRSLRFDGGPSSLVASMPGESVSDLAVQGTAVVWTDSAHRLGRFENGITTITPGAFNRLYGSDDDLIVSVDQGTLSRVDASGVTPIPSSFIGTPSS